MVQRVKPASGMPSHTRAQVGVPAVPLPKPTPCGCHLGSEPEDGNMLSLSPCQGPGPRVRVCRSPLGAVQRRPPTPPPRGHGTEGRGWPGAHRAPPDSQGCSQPCQRLKTLPPSLGGCVQSRFTQHFPAAGAASSPVQHPARPLRRGHINVHGYAGANIVAQ